MIASALYVLVVAMLRLVGQQALAKMSGYDVVLTVSLGSVLATVVLTPGVTITQGATALVAFVALQEGTRWRQSRWLAFHHVVRQRHALCSGTESCLRIACSRAA